MNNTEKLAILCGACFLFFVFLFGQFVINPWLSKESHRQEIVFGGSQNSLLIRPGETGNYFITTPSNLKLPKDKYMLSTDSNAISYTIKENRVSITAKEEGIALISITNEMYDYSYEIMVNVKAYPHTEKITEGIVEIE